MNDALCRICYDWYESGVLMIYRGHRIDICPICLNINHDNYMPHLKPVARKKFNKSFEIYIKIISNRTTYEDEILKEWIENKKDKKIRNERKRVRQSIPRYVILKRDDFKCIYCGRSSITDGVILHVDHIHPFSRGGSDAMDNLVTACSDCNLPKHDIELNDDVKKEIRKVILKRNRENGY